MTAQELDNQKRLEKIIKDNLPARYCKSLLKLAKPAIYIRTVMMEEDSIIPPGCSRIGGNPDLPIGLDWPKWKNKPLSFLLQINLKDITGFPIADCLPKEGMLSFFYDTIEQPWGFDPADKGRWKVFCFNSSNINLLECKKPAPGIKSYDCSLLRFQEILTLPPWGTDVLGQIGLPEDEEDAYRELLDEIHNDSKHQMFGYPAQIQGEMQIECQLVTHGLYCGDDSVCNDPRAKELIKNAHQWQLLLQLDSDDGANMVWGDYGRLFFWIQEGDLKQVDFDNVWLILQCE